VAPVELVEKLLTWQLLVAPVELVVLAASVVLVVEAETQRREQMETVVQLETGAPAVLVVQAQQV